MLNYYASQSSIHYKKKPSYTNLSLNISTKPPKNIPSRNYNQLYMLKASSLDKINIYAPKQNVNTKLNSVTKQIQSKKTAASSKVVSNAKTEGNTTCQVHRNYSSYNSKKEITPKDKDTSLVFSQKHNNKAFKSNLSQDKLLRQKLLTVSTDFTNFINESYWNNNSRLDSAFTSVKIKDEKWLRTGKPSMTKDQPLKVHTDSNFSFSKNNHSKAIASDSHGISITENNFTESNITSKNQSNQPITLSYSSSKPAFNESSEQKFTKHMNNIETKMKDGFKENSTNSKNKKYNTIKHAFEDIWKEWENGQQNPAWIKLWRQWLIFYHEIVSAFSVENREMKERNSNLNTKIEKLVVSLNEKARATAEKDKEIESWKKKIDDLKSMSETSTNTNNQISSNEKEKEKEKEIVSLNSNNKENICVGKIINIVDSNTSQLYQTSQSDAPVENSENKRIRDINKNNWGDLDAWYFFDKVEMKQGYKSSNNIPLLPFNATKVPGYGKANAMIMNNNNNNNNSIKNKFNLLKEQFKKF